MDPQAQFCHTPDCPTGRVERGKIRVHGHKQRRFSCTTCGHTLAATSGTPFYRKRTEPNVMPIVLTLPCHGCPLRAIVAAYGFDERTVAAWRDNAGGHTRRLHAARRRARARRPGACPGR